MYFISSHRTALRIVPNLSLLYQEADQIPQGNASDLHTQSTGFRALHTKEMTPTKCSFLTRQKNNSPYSWGLIAGVSVKCQRMSQERDTSFSKKPVPARRVGAGDGNELGTYRNKERRDRAGVAGRCFPGIHDLPLTIHIRELFSWGQETQQLVFNIPAWPNASVSVTWIALGLTYLWV